MWCGIQGRGFQERRNAFLERSQVNSLPDTQFRNSSTGFHSLLEHEVPLHTFVCMCFPFPDWDLLLDGNLCSCAFTWIKSSCLGNDCWMTEWKPKATEKKKKEKAHCTWRRGVGPPIKRIDKILFCSGARKKYNLWKEQFKCEHWKNSESSTKVWFIIHTLIDLKRHDLWGIEVKLSSK